jgi:PKD repeat protein
VSDGVNTTVSPFVGIAVGTPPVATITSPTDGSFFVANQVINFSGTGFDQDDGPLAASRFSWTVVFHHDTHIHPVLGPLNGVTSGSFTVPDTGHDFHDQTSYEILLTVTDSSGLKNTTSVTIYPDKVNLTFATTPPGGTVVIDGLPETTPFILDSLKGFLHTIEAPTPITIGTSQYNFTSWSDGGAVNHTIATPTADASYTATYTLNALPGPVAAYNFDETTGTTVADASGFGNTGTITGATHVTTGKYSGALSFNGTSNFVTVADANSLDLTTGMTIEAWINPSVATGTRDVIIKEGTGVDIYNLYYRDDAGKPEGNVFVGGSNRTALGTSIPINTWTHLAATYNGTALQLFINGVSVASTTVTGAITTSNGVLRIGGNGLWGEWFQGMIDDVRIYSRALTTSEINTDMATPVSSLPVNHAPTAVIGANPTSGAVPLVVNFNSTGSGDPDAGDTITYAWDLDNDGQFNDGNASTAQFTFTTAGTKTVRLQVTDNHGLSSVATTTISVTNPNNQLPTMIIDTPSSSLPWKVGDGISFSGHATDPEDVNVATSGLNWQFILHQGASTQVLQTFNGVSGGTFTVPNEPYPSTLEIKATATDSSGGQGTSSVTISPQIVSLNFATSPTGLQLSVNGTISTAPFSRTVIVNSVNAVIATSSQTLNSTSYFFANWSDNGAATHNITAPALPATYTATYTTAPGPVAAYNFNAGSGTTLADITGNGNNGTIAGASWITTGHSGGALNFTANSQMVTVPDSAFLDLTTGMTLEAWIYPTSNSGTRDVLIKEGTGVDIYNMYQRSGGKAEANVFVGGANRTAQASPPPANTWTYLAATYDGANVKLFMNGVQVASTAFAGTIATSTGALRMGGNSLWGEWFRGRMDDVRIYNRALTAGEITTDMNTAVAAPLLALPASLNDVTTPPATTPPGTNSGSVFNRKTPIRVSSLIDLVDTV